MSEDVLFELAKQGNPEAITVLVSQFLQKQDIAAEVGLKEDGCIEVALEQSELANHTLVELIHQKLIELEVDTIQKVHIFRQTDELSSAWKQEFELKPRLSAVDATNQPEPNVPLNQVSIPERIRDTLTEAIRTIKSIDVSNLLKSIATKIKLINKSQLVGIIGAILLLIGIFTPVINYPLIGSSNYFSNGFGNSLFLILLSLISIFFLINDGAKWLWISGFSAFILVFVNFGAAQYTLWKAQSSSSEQFSDPLFRGLSPSIVQETQLQGGWIFLLIGAALLTVSALLKGNQKKNQEFYIAIAAVSLTMIVLVATNPTGVKISDSQLSRLNQAIVSRQFQAKYYIRSINKTQQNFYLERNEFVTRLEELGLRIPAENENYSYKVTIPEKEKAIATATAKRDELKSYTGMVVWINLANRNPIAKTILCETSRPAKIPPAVPLLMKDELQCPANSVPLSN